MARKTEVARWKALGNCSGCGGLRRGELLRCSRCREKEREARATRIATRLCTRCGGPRDGDLRICAVCRLKITTAQQARRRPGMCSRCGHHPAAPGFQNCQRCIDQVSRYRSAFYNGIPARMHRIARHAEVFIEASKFVERCDGVEETLAARDRVREAVKQLFRSVESMQRFRAAGRESVKAIRTAKEAA